MYNIRFKNIKIHNFLSFGDADVSLDSRGFTFVSGRNNNEKDGALSNGSGKSTLFNAICYALTGETINGLSTNICNLYTNDNCFVDLLFTVDEDEYEVKRIKNLDGSSSLKIYVNGEDKSGKGIRESSKILNDLLPDLDSSFIGNVIILGQGMPHKFSNNTPAGRKELLEKLSKSDFMIEDIKERLSNRKDELLNNQKEVSTNKIRLEIEKSKCESTVNLCNENISKLQNELESSKNDYEKDTKEKESIQEEVSSLEKEIEQFGGIMEDPSSKIKLEETIKLKEISDFYGQKDYLLSGERKISFANVDSLEESISKWENAGDTCPFCGGKITEKCKEELNNLYAELEKEKEKLNSINEELATLNATSKDETNKVKEYYNKEIAKNSVDVNKHNNELAIKNSRLATLNSKLIKISNKISSYDSLFDYKEKSISNFKDKINGENTKILELDKSMIQYNEELNNISSRIEVVDKMTTLAKRDFRGFLLKNVIGFINSKAKEYCKKVSNTDELAIELEGNNINIVYCGKAYENLSGGEKQKIDIIIQLSIREMLCKYLGFNSNIIVLDEVFDFLDSKVCQSILNLISEELTNVDSLFIISHHTFDLQLPTDNEIIIEKNSLGVSSIVNG